ncbi:Cytochrome B561 [hydrothermal vent metagenome]|uniref:Cytochrome B561 n=1 Tax=hydrothermal vent metagenome TaxID=652676 RepID=A0A3B0Y6X5_9ZZZZ
MSQSSNNKGDHWHWFSILLHWLTVLMVLSLFFLGIWMVDLTYFDEWYRLAPSLHKSTGVLLFIVTVVRLMWLMLVAKPVSVLEVGSREHTIARTAHQLMYLLLLSVMVFGYLISTADGRAIEVFGIFQLPAITLGIDKQEDIAGVIHFWLAVALMGLVALHAIAALKHHFINKDRTLKRMLGL